MNRPLISNSYIVIVGQQPWDTSIGSNCKNLAVEFSRHNKVLYVNSPLDRFNLWKNKKDPKIQKRLDIIKGREKKLVQINKNLWTIYPATISESVSWIKNAFIFNFFNRINNKKIANEISATIKELGFENIVLFNDNDIYRSFYLKDFLTPKVSVYYSRDFMLAVDYWKRHGTRLEPLLIAKSDLCVANSTYLADYCRKYNPLSFYVGQGCNLELFTNSNGVVPEDMVLKMDRPVIGYVGALQTLRLDLNVIEFIAERLPNYNIVLVGPEDDGFKASALHALANVYFLGPKDPDVLPTYIDVFDVCLNPQLLNEVTIGNYPRKIDEYLAMGKPVVATRTKAMEIFEGYVYMANNKEEYVGLINLALRENNNTLREKRMRFAATHTWENNVREIYRAILTVEEIHHHQPLS